MGKRGVSGHKRTPHQQRHVGQCILHGRFNIILFCRSIRDDRALRASTLFMAICLSNIIMTFFRVREKGLLWYACRYAIGWSTSGGVTGASYSTENYESNTKSEIFHEWVKTIHYVFEKQHFQDLYDNCFNESFLPSQRFSISEYVHILEVQYSKRRSLL